MLIQYTVLPMINQSLQIIRRLFVFLLDITTSQIPGGAAFCYEITMLHSTVCTVLYCK